MNKAQEAFQRLLTIMDELREKCPWDKKQTMESIRHLTIEEVYELADAILEKNTNEIKNELGDILLHIVFYAKIASETNAFDITEVIHAICDKLIVRHPHIYSDVKADDEETVKRNWEQIKMKEGKKSVLEGVPASLPSLVKAIRIQEKARGAGFDWDQVAQVRAKVEEEFSELNQEIAIGNQERITQEFGDLLFSLINYARFVNVNPEEALERTNKKFMKRFMHMEEAVAQAGKALAQMNLDEMDVYWNKAKEVFR
ncbi:MAG: nucleoside triphosphate pyrophosphohydrolase [Bacteroidetes bacterium]|nr:nucleoside triphosphate pyrophosphohydrolase [Bacteroidota bacterium]